MAGHGPKVTARLVAQGIPHRVVPFDPAIRSAVEVAASVGADPAQVLKTLVIEQVQPPGRPLVVMVPAVYEVDLRALAERVGAKRLRMASQADAERLTGLHVGAISALLLAGRPFRFLVAAEAIHHAEVLVSAGERGFDVALAPADLLRLTGAEPVALRPPQRA